MRVITGEYRGRKLKLFKGDKIRPTSDRVKESIFNILQHEIKEKSFLDLFTGTGGMGIEAISRGAHPVVFCDNDKESVALAQSNLDNLELCVKVKQTNALDYLDSTSEKFDIIFIDPPYDTDLGEQAINKIFERAILKSDGIIAFEHRKEINFSQFKFVLKSMRRYGAIKVAFLKY